MTGLKCTENNHHYIIQANNAGYTAEIPIVLQHQFSLAIILDYAYTQFGPQVEQGPTDAHRQLYCKGPQDLSKAKGVFPNS